MTSYFLVLVVQLFLENLKLSPEPRQQVGFVKRETGVLYGVFDYGDEL